MKTSRKTVIAALLTATLLGGCADFGYPGQYGAQPYPQTQPYPSQQYGTAYGVIESIQMVQGQTSASNGMAGGIIGGVIGGLLGSQIGGGNGKTAATVAGAIGGAMVGRHIEQRNGQGGGQYQIGVRLDNGAYQTVVQNSVSDLSVGSRVRIENNTVYRY